MSKKIGYYGEKDLEGLKWVARIIDFGHGLLVSSCINEMYNADSYLRSKPDIFKGEVRKWCNHAFREAKFTMYKIQENMRHKKFWEDYSDTVIDVAQQDIMLFRLSIEQTLKNSGIVDSEMLAAVETARVLLDMGVRQYEELMKEVKGRFGRDYTKEFSEFRLDRIFKCWSKMCDELYKGLKADLNNKNTKGYFDIICKKFSEGAYINYCLKEAYKNNPDFTENKVEVKK